VRYVLGEGFWRLVLTTAAASAGVCAAVYLCGLETAERQVIRQKIGSYGRLWLRRTGRGGREPPETTP
jgi:hypothetical protein